MTIIIGAAVSLFVQYIKNVLKFGEYQTLGAVLVLSLAAAGVYTTLVNLGLWEAFGTVLVTAGAFYTFVIERFKI